jgi:hypothetical protein
MKQLNYVIRKTFVSYLWRGEGKRWFKSRYKSTKKFLKDYFIRIDTQISVTKK